MANKAHFLILILLCGALQCSRNREQYFQKPKARTQEAGEETREKKGNTATAARVAAVEVAENAEVRVAAVTEAARVAENAEVRLAAVATGAARKLAVRVAENAEAKLAAVEALVRANAAVAGANREKNAAIAWANAAVKNATTEKEKAIARADEAVKNANTEKEEALARADEAVKNATTAREKAVKAKRLAVVTEAARVAAVKVAENAEVRLVAVEAIAKPAQEQRNAESEDISEVQEVQESTPIDDPRGDSSKIMSAPGDEEQQSAAAGVPKAARVGEKAEVRVSEKAAATNTSSKTVSIEYTKDLKALKALAKRCMELYIENPKKFSERIETRNTKYTKVRKLIEDLLVNQRHTSATYPEIKPEGKENDESREESILKEARKYSEWGEEIKRGKKKCDELLVTLEEPREKLRELQVALEHLENQSNSIPKEEEIKALKEKYKPYLKAREYHKRLAKVVKSVEELDSKYVQFELSMHLIVQDYDAWQAEERQRMTESLKASIHPHIKPTTEGKSKTVTGVRKSKTVTVREKLAIIIEEEEEEEE